MPTFTLDGVTYEELPSGKVRVVAYEDAPTPRSASPRIFGAPDPFKVRDQQIQEQGASIAARSADRQDANSARQAQNDAARLEFDRNKFEFEKAREAAKNNLSPKERADAIAGYKAGDELDKIIAEIEELYNAGPGSTKGLSGIADYLPLTQNQQFDAAGNAARGFVGTALGFTGGQLNSVQEAQMAVGPYLPQAGDRDATILDKISRLKGLAEASRVRSMALLGGAPDDLGRISPPQRGTGLVQDESSRRLATGPDAEIPVPDAMKQGLSAYFAQNQGRQIDPQDFMAFYNNLARENNYAGGTEQSLRAVTDAFNKGAPVGGITPAKRELGATESFLSRAASTGPGAAIATYLNSAGLGIPGALAGNDGIQAIQEESPIGSFFGNVAGGLTGTAGIARGALAAGAKSLPNALTGANLAYGGAFGTTGDTENPIIGGATGLGVAAAGQGLGQFALGPALGRLSTSSLANRGRGLFGRRALPRAPSLTRSESSISDAIGGDARNIAQTLGDAQSLGIPITLADTNPNLRALAGAASRRSPEAKGIAESAFRPRQLGQVDRLQGALNRDLGPGANIPQLSDDLIKQGRAASRPLYEAAYAAPGASSVDVGGLLGTPTGKDALQKAYRSILDDQGDPLAMGFDLNDAGEVVLTKTPSFQALDYVKRSFDDIAQSGERNPITGAPIGNQSQTSAGNSSRQMRSAIDAVNPDYAAARAAYAGPVGEREALNQGTKFGRMTPDEMKFALDALTPSKKAQFRLGARSDISNQADNVRYASNPFDKVLGSPAAQKKISTLFPAGSDRLFRQYDIERQVADTNTKILGNSDTAERVIADQAFGMSPATAAALDGATAIAGGAGGGLTAARLLSGLSKDSIKMGFGKRKANEIANVLFDQADPVQPLRDITLKQRQSSILGRKARKRNRAVGGVVGGASSATLIAGD
jgi:hypothetical protein